MKIINKKVFIAGHNGMVGSSLFNYLRKKGFKKLIVKNKKELDLREYKKVYNFIKKYKPDFVINCAGKVGGILANDRDPINFLFDNIKIQINIIKACQKNKVKFFINLGSSCIYPKNSKQPIKEDYLLDGKLEKTNEAYALSKIIGLKSCEYFNRMYQLNYFSLMPCNLYGPRDEFDIKKSHFIPALINKFHKSKKNNKIKVEIFGTGKARRELMHVDDLSKAIFFFMIQIYKKKKSLIKIINKIPFINIGTGFDMTIKEYALLIRNIINPKAKIFFNKNFPDGTPRKLLDISKLKSLGWKHSITLEKGILSTYKWYTEN